MLACSNQGVAHSLPSLPHEIVEILGYVFTLLSRFTGTNAFFIFTRNTPIEIQNMFAVKKTVGSRALLRLLRCFNLFFSISNSEDFFSPCFPFQVPFIFRTQKKVIWCTENRVTYSAMHKKRYKPKSMFKGLKINLFRFFLGAFERVSKNRTESQLTSKGTAFKFHLISICVL